MKKFLAFTLTEVLITLGIIGIVATLTLPNLMEGYKKKETIASLKKVVSDLETAVSLSEIDNGPVADWKIGSNTYEASSTLAEKYLVPYMKVSRVCAKGENYGDCRFDATSLKGATNYYSRNSSRCTKIFLNSGAIVMPCTYSNYIEFIIDINGKKSPNKLGRDIYSFELYKNVGYINPKYVSATIQELKSASTANMCNKAQSGEACAALIMAEDWEITDNYPW